MPLSQITLALLCPGDPIRTFNSPKYSFSCSEPFLAFGSVSSHIYCFKNVVLLHEPFVFVQRKIGILHVSFEINHIILKTSSMTKDFN